MANRHAHKKLRAEVRARMGATGESYQRAHTRLATRVSAIAPRTDLVPLSYYGVPVTLATIEMHGMAVAVLIPSSTVWDHGYPKASPVPLMRAVMRLRGAA
ncbi:MAG: hypothetical protein M3O46_00090 [Myxococcota bacterium]|nr:hypothetical protein [Myxococcota bacterium]